MLISCLAVGVTAPFDHNVHGGMMDLLLHLKFEQPMCQYPSMYVHVRNVAYPLLEELYSMISAAEKDFFT